MVKYSGPTRTSGALRAWVRGAIRLLQPLDAGVRVDLRRLHRRVPEQLLYGAQVGAGIQEMRREGVAQRVRGQPPALADEIEQLGHGVLQRARADPLPTCRQEERRAIRFRPERAQQLV